MQKFFILALFSYYQRFLNMATRMNLSSKVADKMRSASLIAPGPRMFQTVSMVGGCKAVMW